MNSSKLGNFQFLDNLQRFFFLPRKDTIAKKNGFSYYKKERVTHDFSQIYEFIKAHMPINLNICLLKRGIYF
jgi:hypothetical protein